MIHFFDELDAPTLFIIETGSMTKAKRDTVAVWLAENGGSLGSDSWMGLCPLQARSIFLLLMSGEA